MAIEILCLLVCAASLVCTVCLMRSVAELKQKQRDNHYEYYKWSESAISRHYKAMDLLEPMQQKLDATAKHLGVRNGKYVYVEEDN